MVFMLADADGHDWRAKKASTLVGSAAPGPVTGFEAKDAPASAALAEFAGALDESWRSGTSDVERFAKFRALSDEARSARSEERSVGEEGVSTCRSRWCAVD